MQSEVNVYLSKGGQNSVVWKVQLPVSALIAGVHGHTYTSVLVTRTFPAGGVSAGGAQLLMAGVLDLGPLMGCRCGGPWRALASWLPHGRGD